MSLYGNIILLAKPTACVEQYLLSEDEAWSHYNNSMRKVYDAIRESKQNTVAWHRAKLGKPSFLFKGSEYQYKVYNYTSYRLFVANGKGICLEIPESDANIEVAKDAVSRYLASVGM